MQWGQRSFRWKFQVGESEFNCIADRFSMLPRNKSFNHRPSLPSLHLTGLTRWAVDSLLMALLERSALVPFARQGPRDYRVRHVSKTFQEVDYWILMAIESQLHVHRAEKEEICHH